MNIRPRIMIIFTVLVFFPFTQTLLADSNIWNIAIQAGVTTPTEDAGDYLDDDISLGIAIEYMAYSYLGCRIIYEHHTFQADISDESFEINSFSILASAAYKFSDRFRLFALLGPTYFSANNQEILGLGSDGEDIGWSGGVGFDIFLVSNWSIRMQSVYHSALIGTGDPRLSWVDSSVGFSFYF